MSARGEKDVRLPALTRRGGAQLLLGGALLAAGLAGGWHAPTAAGIALLAACAVGLAEVLLARTSVARRRVPALFEARSRVESWVRVDQRGEVLESLSAPGSRRGLYRQQSVRLVWEDAFGFWRAERVEPAAHELRVPPTVSAELVRAMSERSAACLLDQSPEQDCSSVRPYEKGDGIRQISWRQSAHHGELMSFERAGQEAPAVLVVADTLGAGTGDELASALAAALQALRRSPDVLLSDGTRTLRAPVQQERFCAAVVGEPAGADEAKRRARELARLAGAGSGRRRVVLVTCDPAGELAQALTRGPIGRAVTVVRAEGAAAPSAAREGTAEKDVAAPAPPVGEAAHARPHAAVELLGLLASCALAALATIPFGSIFYEGVWQESVPWLLVGGAAAGSLVGAILRWRRAGRGARAALTGLVVALIVVAGTVAALAVFDGRHGPLTDGLPQAQTAFENPVAALRLIFETGPAQLGGMTSSVANRTWDLLVVLMGSALAALVAVLASARSLAPAVALVPVALSAAGQSIMGSEARLDGVGAVVSLGLLLVWLSRCRRPRAARGALVAALALALGMGAASVAPSGEHAGSVTAGTQIETLVDLSRDLRARSSARALTYETSASEPLYLRTGILERFDGSEWRFVGETDDALVDRSPLAQAALANDAALGVPEPVTTTVRSSSGTTAVPPGTATVTASEEGAVRATSCYVAPVATAADVDELPTLRSSLARRSYVADAAPSEGALALPSANLPESVSQVVGLAIADGIDPEASGFLNQLDAVRWLVAYFTDGSFSYSLDAAGGDQGNLAAIGSFLESRSGYCTHYATTFALLARELGVPSRVALGFAPSSEQGSDGSYVVTMRQLHAWVEVWLDGIGWVGVDVTPASQGGTAAPEAEGDQEIEPETPAADPSTPEETPAEPEQTPQDDTPAEGEKNDAAAIPWQAPVLLAVAVAVVGAAAALLARRRKLRSWQDAWKRVCRIAWHVGVRWDRSATEDLIAAAICERLDEAQAAEVLRISRNACQERYGGHPAPFKQPSLQAIARTLRRGHR